MYCVFFLLKIYLHSYWSFDICVNADIKELITLDDVMEELKLGPNGALIYCMEYASYLKYFLSPPLIV